jgi:hypothetical protein
MIQLVAFAAASDPRPYANNVVAGWVGFAVFIFLIAAVAFLGWSFTRQLRKVRAAQERGVYDDPETDREPADDPEHHSTPS